MLDDEIGTAERGLALTISVHGIIAIALACMSITNVIAIGIAVAAELWTLAGCEWIEKCEVETRGHRTNIRNPNPNPNPYSNPNPSSNSNPNSNPNAMSG